MVDVNENLGVLDEMFKPAVQNKVIEEVEPTQGDVGVLDDIIGGASPVTQMAERNTSLATEQNPDEAAKVYDLSKRSGLPSPTVRANPSKVERQVSGYKGGDEQFDAYLAAHPSNAAISQDDWDGILQVHKTIKQQKNPQPGTFLRLATERLTFGSVFQTVAAAGASSVISIFEGIGETADLVRPIFVSQEKLDAFAAQKPIPVTLSKDIQAFLRSKYGDTKAEELIASSVESLGQMAALAVTGGAGVVLPGMSILAGVSKAAQAQRGGAGRGEQATAFVFAASVEYLTEKIPFDIMLGKTQLKSFLSKLAVGAAFDIPGELLATANEMWLIDQELLGGQYTREQYEQALIDTALVSILTTGVATTVAHPLQRTGTTPEGISTLKEGVPSHDPGAPTIISRDISKQPIAIQETFKSLMTDEQLSEFNDNVAEAQKANNENNVKTIENMDELKGVVDLTKTAERSRDHTKELLKELKQSDEDVFVSNEFWDDYFEQSTPEDQTVLLEKLGVSHDQIAESRLTGTDLAVKANDILTLAPEEYAVIKDDFKPSPDAYTRNDIKDKKDSEDIKNTTTVLAEKSAQQQGVNKEISRLEKEVGKLELPDSKFTKDAPILLRGLANRLATLGVDPVQKLKNLSFKRTTFEKFKQTAGLFFAQAPTDIDFKLSQDIATLSIRIDKLDPTDPAGKKLIMKLEGQRAELESQLRERAFIGFDTFLQAAPKKGKPRGVVTLDGERRIVQLFEGADLSTVLHEIGHIALLEYTALEQSGEASDALKKDMGAIREWVGAEEGAELTVEQSEQFARGFELYLREGKAPTSALRAAFERFKSYLKSVYPVAKLLNVKLNKDVRQVMDRMISASVAVENAAQSVGMVVKTEKEMSALGIPKPAQEFANNLLDKAVKEAESKMTQAQNKDLAKFKEQWAKEAPREIRNEIPAFRIIDDIIKDGQQFDRDDFINAGQVEIKDLPTSKLVKKDGANIDLIAATYFETDAESMIEQIASLPSFQFLVEQRIDEKQAAHDAQFAVEDFITDLPDYRAYLELIGQYVASQAIPQEEIDAGIQRNIGRWETEAAKEVSKESPELRGKQKQVAIDERVQDKIAAYQLRKGKLGALSTDSLKLMAKETMASKSVEEARNGRTFLSAIKKAHSDERRAIKREDWAAALDANERARFNYEMITLSKEARDETQVILKRAKRIGNSKTIVNPQKEAILHLIDKYRLAPLTPTDPATLPNYAELFAGDAFGYSTFPMPDFLAGNVKDFRKLRMEQLRELDKAIRYLEGQGRENRDATLTTGELVQDVADTALPDFKGHKKVYEDGTTLGFWVGKSRAFFSTSDRMQVQMIAAGGYQNIGSKGKESYIEKQTVNRIFEADDNEVLIHDKLRDDLAPHFKQIQISIRDMVRANRKVAGKLRGHKIVVQGVPVPEKLQNRGKQPNWWTPEQIFSVALNRGNVGNATRLINGYEGLTDDQVNTLMERLAVEDMTAVQGIWNTMESLYDDMDKVFFKLNNYHLDKVEILPFTFKGKNFAGGYYPAVYDGRLSDVVAKQDEAIKIGKNENAKFQNPYLKKNFTRGRAEGGSLPIKLRLGVINNHFRDVVHYITHSEVVRDVDLIFRNKDFKDAFVSALGEESYKALRPSLAHVASPKLAGVQSPENRVVEHQRRLASAYMILANFGVMVKQTFSTGGAVHDIGVKNYINGVGKTMKSPNAAYKNMMNLSPRMRNRKNKFDREFATLFSSVSPEQKALWWGDKNITVQEAKAVLGWGVRFFDTMTVTPAWTGAFEGRLLENGQNITEAVEFADNKIRVSQPSAAPIDLPYLQRAGGVLRLAVNFQTFWLKYAERQRLHYRAARVGSMSKTDYAWFTLIETVAPAIGSHFIMSLLWGRDVGDDEVQKDILKDAFMQIFTKAVPFVGGFFNPYGDPFESPVLEGFNIAKDTIVDMQQWIFGDLSGKKKRELNERLMWDLLKNVSWWTGVPVSQVARRAVKGAKQKGGIPGVELLLPTPKNKQ